MAFGGIAGLSNSLGRAEGGAIALLLACGIPCVCGILLLAVVLEQIRVYAERAAILEGKGWLEAFGRGWQVLREHFGPTLVIWLIFLVIGLVFAAIVVGGVLVALAPFIVVFSRSQPPAWIFLPICTGGLIGIVVAAIIGSVVQTFMSSTWTLTYRQLAGQTPATSAPAVAG